MSFKEKKLMLESCSKTYLHFFEFGKLDTLIGKKDPKSREDGEHLMFSGGCYISECQFSGDYFVKVSNGNIVSWRRDLRDECIIEERT